MAHVHLALRRLRLLLLLEDEVRSGTGGGGSRIFAAAGCTRVMRDGVFVGPCSCCDLMSGASAAGGAARSVCGT